MQRFIFYYRFDNLNFQKYFYFWSPLLEWQQSNNNKIVAKVLKDSNLLTNRAIAFNH